MRQLNKRQYTIVKHLLNADGPVSSSFLAVLLGSNDKTIKSDMRVVAQAIAKAGAELMSKAGTGYYLQIIDDEAFATAVQDFNDKYKDNYYFPSSNADRVNHIVRRLMHTEEYVKSETLQEELYVSSTTVSADLKSVRTLLKSYGLAVSARPNHGICLKGREFHIRFLMADYLFPDNAAEPAQREGFEEIKRVLIQLMNAANVLINHSSVNKIVNLIDLSRTRHRAGRRIDLSREEIEEFSEGAESALVAELLGTLGLTELAADSAETAFLALALRSRRVYRQGDHFDIRKERQVYILANRIQDLLYRVLELDLFLNNDLKLVLCKHLRGLLLRLRFELWKRDFPLLSIKQSSAAFEVAVLVCGLIGSECGRRLPETEIAYMAYVFDAYYAEQTAARKCDILLVVSGGLTVAERYSAYLKKTFAGRVSRVECIEFYQLGFTDIDDYDCILTDIPVIRFDAHIPILQLHDLTGAQDKAKLFRFFAESRTRGWEFLNCFHEGLFFREVSVGTKEEAIDYLCGEIEKKTATAQGVREMVLGREAVSSTECDYCAALPHTLYFAAPFTYIAVCILKRPILWEREHIQVVFLTVNGRHDAFPFVNLGTLKMVLADKELVCGMTKVNDYAAFMHLIEARLADIDFTD